MSNVYCFNKNVFKISNLIENEIFLNVDQDCLVTILFIINENYKMESSEFGFKSK